MPFDADDIAAFNDTDMPGYALATIGADTVAGRFRAPYAEALGIAGSSPSFSAASGDLSGVSQGGAITIAGTGYTVTAIEPQSGSGQTRLRLQEAS
jgi:hypothetical protein